jgi:hypothetical protein
MASTNDAQRSGGALGGWLGIACAMIVAAAAALVLSGRARGRAGC